MYYMYILIPLVFSVGFIDFIAMPLWELWDDLVGHDTVQMKVHRVHFSFFFFYYNPFFFLPFFFLHASCHLPGHTFFSKNPTGDKTGLTRPSSLI